MIDHAVILEAKLAKMFPDAAVRVQIENELNRYGLEKYERERTRVQLAILKVAGISFEQIKKWTDIAKQDYRDVLASAEYPNQLTAPTWRFTAPERKAIEDKDAEQYRRWIEEK